MASGILHSLIHVKGCPGITCALFILEHLLSPFLEFLGRIYVISVLTDAQTIRTCIAVRMSLAQDDENTYSSVDFLVIMCLMSPSKRKDLEQDV